MSLKNYYAILGVPQSATGDEVRAAFRVLAKKYHPDVARDNPFADAHFRELQEAYEVLSGPARRIAYDEERWLRGLSSRANAAVRITPQWILNEVVRLRRHMATVDTYHMNNTALRDYIVSLLRPEHLSVLQDAPESHPIIIEEILTSAQKLRYIFIKDVVRLLLLVAGDKYALRLRITRWEASRDREAKWDFYRPLIVVLATMIICALIWRLK